MYENFTPQTVAKADRLFADVFSDVGEGFIVICADMEPAALQKRLVWYAGEFPVSGRSEKRPRVRFQPVSGQSTTFRSGAAESIDVLLSAAVPMNAANLCASRLATSLLEDSLHGALVGTGFHVSVASSYLLYPQERFSVLISLDRIPEDGFAYGSLDDTEILSVLARLRTALTEAPQTEWPASVLKAFKARLNNEYGIDAGSADHWRDALVIRYADGRDFSTKIADRMNAVTAEQVMDVLRKLVEGSRIEYVVMK